MLPLQRIGWFACFMAVLGCRSDLQAAQYAEGSIRHVSSRETACLAQESVSICSGTSVPRLHKPAKDNFAHIGTMSVPCASRQACVEVNDAHGSGEDTRPRQLTLSKASPLHFRRDKAAPDVIDEMVSCPQSLLSDAMQESEIGL